MAYYMGIDAGGSKTYAVIINEQGIPVGMGKGGNGNHQLDRDCAESSLQAATHQALLQAGLSKEQIRYAWLGLAGADREGDYAILRPIVQRLGLPHTGISCDTTIALRAGTTRPYGVVIICGTGVNCSGINRQGETYQCGGFGYRFGDYGGGSDLSVEVFRSVIRDSEGRGKPTLLTGLLLAELGYPSVEDMVNDYLDQDKSLSADLAQLLFTAGRQGDAVAQGIVDKQGEELGLAAAATIRKLHMEQEQFDVVLAGSILTRGDEQDRLKQAILQQVKAAAPLCSLQTLTVEPVTGALILAMEQCGEEITPFIQENLLQINALVDSQRREDGNSDENA